MKATNTEPVWDWYQATVEAHPRQLELELVQLLEVEHTNVTRGMHSYAHGLELVRGGDVVARMLYGGQNPHPNVWATGEDAQRFAVALRELHPAHRVTRCDSAYDFRGAGSWAELYGLVLELATRKGLKINTQGDWLRENSDQGRTLYVGSFKSPVMLRLYEKGKQLRSSGVVAPRHSPLDWVRLEVQVRPHKSKKAAAAAMSSRDVWGLSSWTHELHELVLGGELERVQMHEWRAPDDARAWRALLSQYGKLLERKALELGEDGAPNWPMLGVLLDEALSAPLEDHAAQFDVRAAAARLRASRGL